jgi:hypothetical protein
MSDIRSTVSISAVERALRYVEARRNTRAETARLRTKTRSGKTLNGLEFIRRIA